MASRLGARSFGWLLAAILSVPALACAAVGVYEGDVFFHFSFARAVLAAGSRVVPEPVALPAFSDPAVAAEWAWGVLSYAVYSAFGAAALNYLTMFFAVVAVLGVVRLAQQGPPQSVARPATVLVACLAAALLSGRLYVRPHMVFLAILPWFVLACRSLAVAGAPPAYARLAALVGTEVLWAQFHGSFVLAPVIYLVCVAPSLRSATPEARQRLWFGLLGLALGLLTSAFGTDLLTFLFAHGAGYAVRHNNEMRPPAWADWNPATNVFAAYYEALWGLGLAGALVLRRMPWRELGLALLSAALTCSSGRYGIETAALLVPFALTGASALIEISPRALGGWTFSTLTGALALAGTLHTVAADRGPIGRLGLQLERLPALSAAYLERRPDVHTALTEYSASAPLGFWLYGHTRTYVDGRAPLYFDDTDFAVSRELLGRATALQRIAKRYAVDAIVMRRDFPTCAQVPAEYRPVVLDPLYTTFVRARAARDDELRALHACGPAFLDARSCAEPERLERELARLRALGNDEFASHLGAVRTLVCGGDAARALAELRRELVRTPSRESARWLLAQAYLQRGEVLAAFELLESELLRGELKALQVFGARILDPALPERRVKAALTRLLAELDDAAPASARLALAQLCMRASEPECVRFQAIRAAASGGEVSALRAPLEWLASHHPNERVRADASAWWSSLTSDEPLTDTQAAGSRASSANR